MKVHKPDTLSLLFRCLVTPRQPVAVLSALAGFRFGEQGMGALVPEAELWAAAAKRLGAEQPLDLCLPKPSAEYLVYGSCHAPELVQGLRVRASVHGREKTLHVVGDRRWRQGRPTEPRPFRSMSLGWENAYGGPGFPRNPKGKGRGAGPDGPRELPNILLEGEALESPDQEATPAGFGGIPFSWPQRADKLGTYDAAWLRDRWPYYPGDTRLEYACAAPADQRLPGFLRGDERCVLERMHPEKPRQEFALPAVQARVFLERQEKSAASFFEVLLKLDTLFLFPEDELGVLLFRGFSPVGDEELDDVLHCAADLEPLDRESRPESYYRAKLSPPAQAPAAKPAPPPPAAPAPPAPEPPPAGELDPAARDLESLTRDIETRLDQVLAGQGLGRADAERMLAKASGAKKPVTMDDLLEEPWLSGEDAAPEEMLDALASHVAEMEAGARKALMDSGMSLEQAQELIAGKQVSFSPEDLSDVMRRIEAHPTLPDQDKSAVLANLAVVENSLGQLDELAPPDSPPDEEKPPEPEPPVAAGPGDGAEAAAMHARGESLADYDMRGFDFSGRDLAGAVFASANLDGADFTSARLAKADFTEAGLLGARLAKADCAGAVFRQARAAGADFTKAVLREADLSEADMSRAGLAGAVLDAARLDHVLLESAGLSGASLKGARGWGASFLKADLSGAGLDSAELPEADFTQADLSQARMSGLRAAKIRLGEARCEGCDLRGAVIPQARGDEGTSLAGSDISGADLRHARLERANLAGARLAQARLDGADLARVDCSGADFAKASLKRAVLHKAGLQNVDARLANLFKASLRMADARGAVFRGANLFGADLYKARLSSADLEDANLKRTVLRMEALHEF